MKSGLGRVRTSLFAAVMSATLVSALASPAAADGGPSIATAPGVPYGVLQFGNTTSGGTLSGCLQQYWLLSVVAGDHITIDWEVQSTDQSSMHLHVYPVGTTDFNVGDTDPYGHFYLNSNLKAESIFDVPSSGVMPMGFYTCGTPGPYDFTAYVQHVMAVSLQQAPSRLPLKGSLAVSAANPDGVAITAGVTAAIQVKQSGQPWLTVGSAALTAAPTSVPYSIPRALNGKQLALRAVVSGAGYATKGSTAQKVTVGQKATVDLHAERRNVPRLQKAHLDGRATGVPKGTKVVLQQRQAGGGAWGLQDSTRTAKDGTFHLSDVVHQGDRYYRACVKSVCSRKVFVHVVS